MNLDLVIRQIKLAAPLFAGNVAGSADFQAGLSDQVWLAAPAAYAMPGDMDAEPNDAMNGEYQPTTERVAVVVQFDNRADRRGQGSATAYRDVFAALCKALLGWNPDPARYSRGFALQTGRYIEMDRSRLFYEWTFAIPGLLSNEDGWQPGDPDATGAPAPVPLLAIDANRDPGDPPFAARATLPQE